MTNSIDIKAKAPFPAGALSNFAQHAFTFDGIACASMEGLAFEALHVQSPKFRAALAATGNAPLTYSLGNDDPTETILTAAEFCSRLHRLRTRLKA